MTELAQLHCNPIKAETAPISETEVTSFLTGLPGWQTYLKEGELHLEKIFKFGDYPHALAFTNQVAQSALAEDHHPAILLEYGRVTVTWWTHRIHGLHQNDFIMAAKTEQLFEKSN